MLTHNRVSFKKRPLYRIPTRATYAAGELFARHLPLAVEYAESTISARSIDGKQADRVRHYAALGLAKAAAEAASLNEIRQLAERYVWEFIHYALRHGDLFSQPSVEAHEDIERQEARLSQVLANAKERVTHDLTAVVNTSTSQQSLVVAVYLGLRGGVPGLYEEHAAKSCKMSVLGVLSSVEASLFRAGLEQDLTGLLVALEIVAVLEGAQAWQGFVGYADKDLASHRRVSDKLLKETADRLRRKHETLNQLAIELALGLPDGALTERLAKSDKLREALFGKRAKNPEGLERSQRRLRLLRVPRPPSQTITINRLPTMSRAEAVAYAAEIAAEREGENEEGEPLSRARKRTVN